MRIVYGDGGYADFPLEKVIEAIVRFPELRLSESLSLIYRELDAEIAKIYEEKKEVS